MTTRFKLLALVAGLVFAVGCGSDSDGTGTNDSGGGSDGGVTIPDGSGPTFDTGTPTPDTGGVTPTPDGGTTPPTGKTCADIVQCINGCGSTDQACQQGCLSGATTDGQAKFSALSTCLQGAGTGACATPCADQASTDCQNCLTTECKAEVDACLGGGGPAEAGFGDVCDAAAPSCPGGMQCIGVQGGTEGKGFCTKPCTNQGMPCEGSPAGTLAACVLGDAAGTTFYCGFICEVQGQTYTCPSTMTCGGENPPGSGQKACNP